MFRPTGLGVTRTALRYRKVLGVTGLEARQFASRNLQTKAYEDTATELPGSPGNTLRGSTASWGRLDELASSLFT